MLKSSAKTFILNFIVASRSFIKIRNSKGPRIDPWVTADSIGKSQMMSCRGQVIAQRLKTHHFVLFEFGNQTIMPNVIKCFRNIKEARISRDLRLSNDLWISLIKSSSWSKLSQEDESQTDYLWLDCLIQNSCNGVWRQYFQILFPYWQFLVTLHEINI